MCNVGSSGEGVAYMKVNIFRRMVNGIGRMSTMKSVISATKRRKTCERDVSCCWEVRGRCWSRVSASMTAALAR